MIRSHFLAFFTAMTVATLASAPAGAAPVYKCTHGGKVSYGDRPCAHGPSMALPPPAAGVDPEGKNTVPGNDARTLLEIEKLRIAREQTAQRAAQRQERQERARQRADRAAGARHKQCERLKLRQRWAAEDAARARGAKREAAQLKARRQAEALAVECPA
ncbi:DUF4124 domain-containing protein [uncultured Massilia sp.]|uniref:DUF4124 domain-containing protein n=1 Tax=uncultured Massilia sp. TaxID=169973 RepID=UPI0025DF51BF|nr:DUF4124 domain-containing protein [uncultured Massilia sp.]